MSDQDEPQEQEEKQQQIEEARPGAGQAHSEGPITSVLPEDEEEVDLDWEKLMDHEYDGIREYDNPLPGWWVWLFVGSIVFSVFYLWYYHLGVGKSPTEKYEVAMQEYQDRKLRMAGEEVTDEAVRTAMENPKVLQQGEELFKNGQCVACHGVEATGGIGPNLTDVYWKNVKEGRPTEITNVIRNGVQGAQVMTAFEDVYTNEELLALTAYVASLHGKNREGKEPEGEKLEPQWPVSN